MDLVEFHREFIETVRMRAADSNDFTRAAFVEEVGARLADAEEFANFESCRYEGTGSGRRKLKVDGYAFDEADNSLTLLIADFANEETIQTINTPDVKAKFANLQNFLEDAINKKLTDGSIEESNPGYGLASYLIEQHEKVSKYRFYFASDSQLKSRAKDWQEGQVAGVQIEFHIWDIARFHTAHISATGRDELVVDFTEFDSRGLPSLMAAKAEGDYQAYLCMIPGAVLAGIYDQYGSRLLEGNVRSFLTARGKVNAKIQQTIRNQPEMFFAFNNGITATAEGVTFDEDSRFPHILTAKNLQIVNGGQTTASLAMAGRGTMGKQDGADLSKIMIQMKLSVLPPEKAGILIPEIAKYANSQNKVSDADFFANHAYHVRLEDLSRRLYAPAVGGAQHGTHWFYERARGQYANEQSRLTVAQKKLFEAQNPKAQLLTKTDIAKFENTWRRMPHKVSMGAQKNFMLFAELITKDWESDEKRFNEEYFRELVAQAILFKSTEILVKNQPWYQGGYRANIVTYTLAKLHEMISEQALGLQVNLRGIWDKQAVPSALLAQIAVIAKHVFDLLTDPKRPKDNVTEWAKMQACWDRIKAANIPLLESTQATLQNVKDVTNTAKAAKEMQKIDGGIETQAAVVSVGGSQWAAMLGWAEKQKLLTPKEAEVMRIAAQIPRKLPNEKQCAMLWQLRSKLIGEGFKS